MPLDADAGERAVVRVLRDDVELDLSVKQPRLQRAARLHTEGLADFRRIDTVQPHLHRRAAGRGSHPDRVAVGDMCHPAIEGSSSGRARERE